MCMWFGMHRQENIWKRMKYAGAYFHQIYVDSDAWFISDSQHIQNTKQLVAFLSLASTRLSPMTFNQRIEHCRWWLLLQMKMNATKGQWQQQLGQHKRNMLNIAYLPKYRSSQTFCHSRKFEWTLILYINLCTFLVQLCWHTFCYGRKFTRIFSQGWKFDLFFELNYIKSTFSAE